MVVEQAFAVPAPYILTARPHVRASHPFRRRQPKQSQLLKDSRSRVCILFSRPGLLKMFRSAGTASPDRSCRPWLCWPKRHILPSRKSSMACPVIFAGAVRIIVSDELWHARHRPTREVRDEPDFAPNSYLHIAPDGRVTVVVPRSEMGQGVLTALPMILAEELDADWSQIAIQQAGASVRTTWDPMRQAGAAAREMLMAAAAQEWGVPTGDCTTDKGFVVHTGLNHRAGYGELAERAAKLPVPKEPKLKDSSQYKLIGKPAPRLDTPSKTNGTAEFGIDFRIAGMKYAFLARCPVIGGKMASFDDSEARKVAGVVNVVKVGDSAVAVAADSVFAAMQGRKALKVTWDDGPNKDLNTAAVFNALHKAANDKAVS